MLKKILIALAVVILIGLGVGYYFYQQIFGPNLSPIKTPYTLLIPRGASFDTVYHRLTRDSVLRNNKSFRLLAKWMHYDRPSVPSGRYVLKGSLSNYALISKLRIANQDPIRLTFSSARTYRELCGKLASPLSLDSLTLLVAMDSVIHDSTNQINRYNILCHFIPNTYLIYWDITPKKLLSRLFKERDKYWRSSQNKRALERLHMGPDEVCTLASIVEKESNLKEERPIIAGVYLNRLHRDIKLQADPTVVFASGNFGLRRILNKHLKIESPYNTYLHTGLPPGPICLPSRNAIESVLKAPEHDYIFFCAKPGYTGAHNFAKDLRGHAHNARIYRKWLNKEHIN